MEQYFRLFFADDARYSVDFYQTKVIGDKDINVTGWEVDEGVLKRTITFTHPIKNSFGVGPSESRTTRRQELRRYKNLGITVSNTTTVEGIPSADAFFVQDHWLIEATGTNEVTVSSRFGSTFTKRAMLKGLIEKNIVKETSEWFVGYQKMLQDVVLRGEEQAEKPAGPPSAKAVVKVDKSLVPVTELLQQIALSLNRSAYIAAGVLAFLAIVLILQLFVMRETMALMRLEITTLREEVGIIAAAVARQPRR